MSDYITYLLVGIAAMLNAVMDRTESEAFRSSIFRNLNEKFWYKRVSWQHAKTFLRMDLDAWHISKSLMIICWTVALAFPPPHPWWMIVGICGVVWNGVFVICYDHLFKKKK